MTFDVRTIVAFCIILIFAGTMFLWMIRAPVMDEGQAAVLNMLIGALIGSTTTVIGFYFGSSSGSKDKDDALINVAENRGTGPSQEVSVVVPKQKLEAEIKP